MGVLDEVLFYILLILSYANGGVESRRLRSWRGMVEREEQRRWGKINKNDKIVTKKEGAERGWREKEELER